LDWLVYSLMVAIARQSWAHSRQVSAQRSMRASPENVLQFLAHASQI
jgi:hypothetical protein